MVVLTEMYVLRELTSRSWGDQMNGWEGGLIGAGIAYVVFIYLLIWWEKNR